MIPATRIAGNERIQASTIATNKTTEANRTATNKMTQTTKKAGRVIHQTAVKIAAPTYFTTCMIFPMIDFITSHTFCADIEMQVMADLTYFAHHESCFRW